VLKKIKTFELSQLWELDTHKENIEKTMEYVKRNYQSLEATLQPIFDEYKIYVDAKEKVAKFT